MRIKVALIAVLMVPLAVIALPSSSDAKTQCEGSSQSVSDSVQTATVELTDDGYTPASITLRPGVLARVTFVRRVEETCGTAVVLPDFNIHRDLPLNEPVVVEFTPKKAGTFTITCGMNMLRGKIIVR